MKINSRRKQKKKMAVLIWMTAVLAGIVTTGMIIYYKKDGLHHTSEKTPVQSSPKELLIEYMNHIPEREWEEMYEMLDIEASGNISQEDFIKRNSAIYEGIEMQNMIIEILEYDENEKNVTYQTSFDTAAGNISFKNKACFRKGEEGYKLIWLDSLIFPEFYSTDKVRVSEIKAKRGEILDRNGRVLAGTGLASSVGIVPGKLENKEEAIAKIGELLEIKPEDIEKKLSAKWVKEDSFVPIQTIRKVEETQLMAPEPDEEVLKEKERQDKLLGISGGML